MGDIGDSTTILPLEGYRIVDLGHYLVGPLATHVLADFGAQVIKVESRAHVDGMRMGPDNVDRDPEKDPGFVNANRNKLGITLNLRKPEAVSLTKQLIKISDVVVENFSPGTLAQLGLDYESVANVKPDIIMVSCPSAGSTGPIRDMVSYGTSLAAISGMGAMTGYPGDRPLGTTGFFCDYNAAIFTTFAVLTALRFRERTGIGQYIEMPQWQITVGSLGEAVMEYTMNCRSISPRGNQRIGFAPHNLYPCQGDDKWVSICVKTDDEWQRLCKAMGDPPWIRDERFSTSLNRQQNQEALDKLVGEWTINYNHYKVMDILQRAGVAAAPYLDSSERFLDPHLQERQTYVEVDHPVIGGTIVGGIPWKFSSTPGGIQHSAPLYGQHNDYVFCELLGLSKKYVAELSEKQIIY